MKILALCSEYPYPPDDGTKLRVFHLLRNLPGASIDLLTFEEETLTQAERRGFGDVMLNCRNVEAIDRSTLRERRIETLGGKIKNVFYPDELSLGFAFYSAEMANRVREKMLGGNYDLVFYSGFYMFLYGQGECRRTPYVVDVIDSFSLYTRTTLMKRSTLPEKLWLAVNYLWAIRYEKIHFSKASNMIFASPVDKAFVQRHCRHSKIWVVENGVDTEYFSERNRAKEEPNALVFTGVMSYQPNLDAARYFAREILPLIRRDVPDVRLIVAGKEPGNELRDLAKEIPGIELTGYLNDIRDAFERASVYVAPIITGAGIKNKVLEAWAMKKAVVGTSMAFHGIEVKNGDNAIVADKPGDFAKGVVKLIGDGDLRMRLGAAGRETVRRSYSWEKQGARLIEIFAEVINGRKAA